MSSEKYEEILCWTSGDPGLTLQTNAGVLFAKDNLPEVALDAGGVPSGHKDVSYRARQLGQC